MEQKKFDEACISGDIIALGKLDYGKIDIHAQNEHIFRWACRCGYIDVIKYLIKLGENKYGKINIHAGNEHAFRWACERGRYVVVEYLFYLGENGYGKINIHASNEYALRMSCLFKHISIVKFLVSRNKTYHKINIHVDNDFALRWSNFRIRQILIKYDPKYDWQKLCVYELHAEISNRMVMNITRLYHYLSEIESDIIEINVLKIVSEYLY